MGPYEVGGFMWTEEDGGISGYFAHKLLDFNSTKRVNSNKNI